MFKLISLATLFGVAFCSVIKFIPHENIQKGMVFDSEDSPSDNFMRDLSEYYGNYLKLAGYRPQERDLNNDLSDFLSLIDVQAVVSTVMDHLGDPEVVELVAFFLSPEFKETVVEFEAIPEFKEAVAFLASKGYDPTPALDAFHEFLSLPPLHRRERDGGVSALIHSIAQALPIADMKAMVREKVTTSPEFADLYGTVTSDEFRGILERMARRESFVSVKIRMERLGIDFECIEKLIDEIFELE